MKKRPCPKCGDQKRRQPSYGLGWCVLCLAAQFPAWPEFWADNAPADPWASKRTAETLWRNR